MDWLSEELEKCFAEQFRRDLEIEQEIEYVKTTIKHPHFQYAVYDTETKEITYKRKKWYKWLSGKRIVHLKVVKISCEGLYEYK